MISFKTVFYSRTSEYFKMYIALCRLKIKPGQFCTGKTAVYSRQMYMLIYILCCHRLKNKTRTVLHRQNCSIQQIDVYVNLYIMVYTSAERKIWIGIYFGAIF